MQRPKVIAIVGPTASGKTSLGIFLAQKIKGVGCSGAEIISADSRQVYRGLNVGTGKVTKKEMGGIPHHLLDVCSPKKVYTAGDFKKDGEKALRDITTKNKIPIIVGGTGLYIDVLLGRIVLPNVPPNPELRKKLEKKSTEILFKMLQKKDPSRAADIEQKNEQNNKHRLVRALEIAEALGKSPSGFRTDTTGKENHACDVLWLGINPSKETLTSNIHARLLARMKAGMVAEAKRLHAPRLHRPADGNGIGLSYKRMEELGLEYRSLARHLRGDTSHQEMLEELERAINRYAKSQGRWFGANKEICWLKSAPNTAAGKKEALRLAAAFLREV
ncbi:MAG: tRNA (adenosine(37)-N6)-dimethylallyltransferase MiaA [bacterium]